MFYRDPQGIYRASEFDQFEWLLHGFGSCDADVPALHPQLATLKQIHSAVVIDAAGRTGVLGQGDALVEREPGSVVAVKTADCVPILLVDPQRRAVAAVHAGWRGTAARIIQAAVAAMDSSELYAAIGPSIGKCCYEVGPEVAVQFGEKGRSCIDLPEINRLQLIQAGVTPRQICASKLCTMCSAGQFHSFRRDGERAGRQYSFAGVRQALQ